MRRPLAVAALVAMALLVGCSGDDPSPTGPTVPVSLAPGATVPGSLLPPDHGATPPGSGDPSPSSLPPTGATGLVRNLRATVLGSCDGGTVPVVLSYELEPDPPVRVLTVLVDGAAGTSGGPDAVLSVPVPCDGDVHTLLLVATVDEARSGTASVAVRTPTG